jgi:hypothetical protein
MRYLQSEDLELSQQEAQATTQKFMINFSRQLNSSNIEALNELAGNYILRN